MPILKRDSKEGERDAKLTATFENLERRYDAAVLADFERQEREDAAFAEMSADQRTRFAKAFPETFERLSDRADAIALGIAGPPVLSRETETLGAAAAKAREDRINFRAAHVANASDEKYDAWIDEGLSTELYEIDAERYRERMEARADANAAKLTDEAKAARLSKIRYEEHIPGTRGGTIASGPREDA